MNSTIYVNIDFSTANEQCNEQYQRLVNNVVNSKKLVNSVMNSKRLVHSAVNSIQKSHSINRVWGIICKTTNLLSTIFSLVY